jgi:hypothetical protein
VAVTSEGDQYTSYVTDAPAVMAEDSQGRLSYTWLPNLPVFPILGFTPIAGVDKSLSVSTTLGDSRGRASPDRRWRAVSHEDDGD